MLVHALIYAGLEDVTVVGYGMKCPFTDFSGLAEHHTPSGGTFCNRYDVGRHVYLPHILLFGITCDEDKGEVFPMLGSLGKGCKAGSTMWAKWAMAPPTFSAQ